MPKKILVIVEGEKKEPEIMSRVLDAYSLSNREIVSYKANIYDLYDHLHEAYDDQIEDVDIQEFLKEMHPDAESAVLLDDNYTDILLIFDFDPQDNRYHADKLKKLLTIFTDSTEMGRLYINYPMVESFFHFRSLEDQSFLDEMFTLEQIQSGGAYKAYVNRLTCIHHLYDVGQKEIARMIRLILMKIGRICQKEHDIDGNELTEKLQEVATIQMLRLAEHQDMFVLNTCVLFVYEYNPRMLEWLDRR